MRLVTLNTWGLRGDWSARLHAFQDGFRALDGDIITRQETILTDEVDQVAEMAMGQMSRIASGSTGRLGERSPACGSSAARALSTVGKVLHRPRWRRVSVEDVAMMSPAPMRWISTCRWADSTRA